MRDIISSLGGKWFRIMFQINVDNGDSQGNCEWDHPQGPTIRVDPSIPLCDVVDTLIHEVLHAQFRFLSEEAVLQAATEITKVLIDTEVITIQEERPDESIGQAT